MPIAKETLRKKQKKRPRAKKLPKTVVALERAEDILNHASKETPSRWKRWLDRYDFIPRKYVALMIFGAIASVLRNKQARDTIFIILARYFPNWAHSLGRTQQALGIASSYMSGEKISVLEIIKQLPLWVAEHHFKAYVAENPESIVIEKDSTKAAVHLVNTFHSFTNLSVGQCSEIAMRSARSLIRNERMLKLVDKNIFDKSFRQQAEAYIPSDTKPMSDADRHDARQFWLIKLCDAQATVNLKHDGEHGEIANRAVKKITGYLKALN